MEKGWCKIGIKLRDQYLLATVFLLSSLSQDVLQAGAIKRQFQKRKLVNVLTGWTWNATAQYLFSFFLSQFTRLFVHSHHYCKDVIIWGSYISFFFFFNRKRVLNGQFLNYYYCRQNLVPFSVEIRILGMKKKRGTIYRRACRTLLCWLMSRTLKVNSGAEMWWDTTRQKIVTVNWNNRFIQFNASYKYNLFWTSGHHK